MPSASYSHYRKTIRDLKSLIDIFPEYKRSVRNLIKKDEALCTSTTMYLQLMQEKYLDQHYSLEDDYAKTVADELQEFVDNLRIDNKRKEKENQRILNQNAQLLNTRRARLHYNLLLVELITTFETYCQDCFIEAISNKFDDEILRKRIQKLNLELDPWELLDLAENDLYYEVGHLIAENYKFRRIDQPRIRQQTLRYDKKDDGVAKAYRDLFKVNIYDRQGIEKSYSVWKSMMRWFTMRHIIVHNNGRVQKVEDEKFIDHKLNDYIQVSIEELHDAIKLFSKVVWCIEKQMEDYFISDDDDYEFPYFSDEEIEELISQNPQVT